jgi:cytoskeletal protein RodZ
MAPTLEGRVFARLHRFAGLPTDLQEDVKQFQAHVEADKQVLFANTKHALVKTVYGVKGKALTDAIIVWLQARDAPPASEPAVVEETPVVAAEPVEAAPVEAVTAEEAAPVATEEAAAPVATEGEAVAAAAAAPPASTETAPVSTASSAPPASTTFAAPVTPEQRERARQTASTSASAICLARMSSSELTCVVPWVPC